MITLTPDEITMILGAGLAFTGRPFHMTGKRILSQEESAILDALRDKLRTARSPNASSQRQIDFSNAEIPLVCEILRACDAEFGDDAIEIRLHLWVGTREMLVGLIRKLEAHRISS